jgi:hypothetical protein
MGDLPIGVRKLLYERVHSLEELELLVWLARRPDRSSTLEDAEDQLQLGWSNTLAAADSLRQSGLFVALAGGDGHAHEIVRAEPLRGAVLDLAKVYQTNRFAVIKLVSEAAMARVRGSMEKAFADAFVLGDRKKRDG